MEGRIPQYLSAMSSVALFFRPSPPRRPYSLHSRAISLISCHFPSLRCQPAFLLSSLFSLCFSPRSIFYLCSHLGFSFLTRRIYLWVRVIVQDHILSVTSLLPPLSVSRFLSVFPFLRAISYYTMIYDFFSLIPFSSRPI